MGFFDIVSKIGSAVTSVANPISAIASPLVSLVEGHNNREAQREANSINQQENDLNRQFNATEAEKQRTFEALQADLANKFASNEALNAFQRSSQFAKEMWNKQNEYNSPSAQIARLKQAGLNPNLFGGDNTAGSAGSVASSAPSASMPHGSSASAGSSIPVAPTTYTNPLLDSAQVRLANAQAKNLEKQAERTEKLLPGEIAIQEGMKLNLGADTKLKEGQYDELQSKMQVDLATIRNLDEQSSNFVTSRGLMELDAKQKEIFLKQYEDRLVTELLSMKSKLRLDEWSIRHIASQIALNASQITLNNANANLSNAQAINANDVHLLNGIELKYKDKLLKLQYDRDNNDYNLSLLTGKKETRMAEFRANDSNEVYRIVNGALDDVEIITRMAGNIFGQMPDYIKRK